MKSIKSISIALLLAICSQNAQTQPAGGYTLNVSEGTSGGLDAGQVYEKYTGLAQVLERALKQKVRIIVTREFSKLEEGMQSGKMDFVLARPSDYPARGLRDYNYQLVSTAKPDGQCYFVVPKDSPIQSLQDIRGKRIALPEKVSYMSKFCSAELMHQGFNLELEKVQHAREQAAVMFYLEHKLVDVGGIASYSGAAKKLEQNGQRVIHKSAPQPYMPLIAHARISARQIQAIRNELSKENVQDDPKGVVKTIGIKEFDLSNDEKRLRNLLRWLNA